MLDFYGRYHSTTYGWDGSPIHDAVAVAAVVRPGLLETVAVNVEVECASDLCRGRTVVDRWRRTDRVANADVGIAVDVEGFFALLLERLERLG